MEQSLFFKLVGYAAIVVFYLVSYLILIRKNDPKLWVLVWGIFALALYVYPLAVLPKWWNCLFFLSVVIVFFSMSYEGNKKAKEEEERIKKQQQENNDKSGFMVSFGGHFFKNEKWSHSKTGMTPNLMDWHVSRNPLGFRLYVV